MVTAHDAHEDICEAMNAGADDYLVKPLDAAQVEIRLIVAARVTSLHRQLANQRTRLATVARREAVLRRA